MSITDYIIEDAKNIVSTTATTLKNLEKEKLEAQNLVSKITKKIETLSVYKDRFENFIPEVGIDYKCPKCWIEENRDSNLTSIRANNADDDAMQCNYCRREIIVYKNQW